MKNRIAFLAWAVRIAAENDEPIEGSQLKGLAELMEGLFVSAVEPELEKLKT